MAGQSLTSGGLIGSPLVANLSPDQQVSLAQIQQRQMIGQALLAQGLQPLDISNRQVGGVGYRVSPLEGVNKIFQAYLGNKLATEAMGQQAQLTGQMYGNAFGSSPAASQPAAAAPTATLAGPTGQDYGFGSDAGNIMSGMPASAPPAAAVGSALLGAPQAAGPARQGGALTLPGKTPQESMLLYSMLGPEAYGKMLSQWAAPTDATRMAIAAGQDPRTANSDALFKNNFVAPNQGTPGTIARDPRTNRPLYYSPDVPKGGEPVFDAGGNVVGVKEVNGALRLIGQTKAAETAAEGSQLPFSGVDAAGNPMPVTNRTAAASGALPAPVRNNNPGALMPGGKLAQYPDMQSGMAALDNNLAEYGKKGINTVEGVISRWAPPNENDTKAYISAVSQRLGIKPDQKIDMTNPLVRQSLSTAIALHENGPQGVFGSAPSKQEIYAAAPMGAQANATAAANNQQGELSKKWATLSDQNQNAQSTIANLQSIKDLAAKAAATGQQADRLTYVNGLLALAGSEKANDAVTANNLLDKYSNQIVARLGQGGLGTDAARAIVHSAYPNAKMTKEAIAEASDNLIGATQLTQAKARLLAPLANARDASAYNNAEVKFDQNADPRIFQYASIQDPVQRQAFARRLMEQDPKIVDKMRALQSLGALQ